MKRSEKFWKILIEKFEVTLGVMKIQSGFGEKCVSVKNMWDKQEGEVYDKYLMEI